MNKIKKEIERIKSEILRLSSPIKIIHFGSSATNKIHENSDIDLIIVIPDNVDGKELNKKLHSSIKRENFPLDLIVVPESYFNQRKSWFGTLYWYAEQEGKTLYERNIA